MREYSHRIRRAAFYRWSQHRCEIPGELLPHLVDCLRYVLRPHIGTRLRTGLRLRASEVRGYELSSRAYWMASFNDMARPSDNAA